MRIRRKKNINTRLAQCEDRLLIYNSEHLDFSTIVDTSIINYQQIFGNNNPVELEIGCGKGAFIVQKALQNPDINYIAVEKNENVLVQACENAVKQGIKNVYFVLVSAEYLLRIIPTNSISRIYLNFSCPFPKKKYACHRLTHARFLEIYTDLLVYDGEVVQKTDNSGLFEFSIEQFSKCGYVLYDVTLDLHKINEKDEIQTEYEKKFSALGMPIFRLKAKLKRKSA